MSIGEALGMLKGDYGGMVFDVLLVEPLVTEARAFLDADRRMDDHGWALPSAARFVGGCIFITLVSGWYEGLPWMLGTEAGALKVSLILDGISIQKLSLPRNLYILLE